MHEEDVHRPLLGGAPPRVRGKQRPPGAARIVGRWGWPIGLERLMWIQRRPEDLITEHEGGDQGERQQAEADDLEAPADRGPSGGR